MKKLAVVFILATTPALAQSPEEQALSQRLLQEIQASVQCNVSLIKAAQDHDRLTAEIKRLMDKYEPKAPDAK